MWWKTFYWSNGLSWNSMQINTLAIENRLCDTSVLSMRHSKQLQFWLQLAIDDLWCCEIDKTCLWISDLSKRDTESYETFLYNQNIWLSWFCNLQLNYKKSYPINQRFKRRMVSLEFWNFPKIIQTMSYAIGKLIIVNYSNRVRILIP